MSRTYVTTRKISTPEFSPDPSPVEIVAEIEADHQREARKLSDLAFIFLTAAGDPYEAEKLLDDVVDLLFEGGAFSLWRYRILLGQIREGL